MVLLFGAETWVLTATKLQNIEGVHVVLLRQVTGTTNQMLGVDTWKKEGGERVIQATGKKPLREYIERRQATVAEWVALRPLFKVCRKETGFEGGGRARKQWWRQTAAELQLKTTQKEILAVVRERRRQEFGRHGSEGASTED